MLALGIERIEVDWLKQKLRKPALRDDSCNGFPRIGKQDIRAEAAYDDAKLFFFVTGYLKQAGLMQFDEKECLVFVLCLDRNRQDDLALVFFTLTMLASKIEVRFGAPFACRKDRWTIRRFE